MISTHNCFQVRGARRETARAFGLNPAEEERELPPEARGLAERLVGLPVKGKFLLEKGVAERIILATGCKPYLIQKMCISLINRMHDAGRRVVLVDDVEVVGRLMEK